MCREKLSSPSPFRLSHHNSNMSSSIQPVHVHFPALLEQPPIDRVRKVRLAQVAPWPFFMYVRLSMKKTYAKRGLVYPKLAQSKGSGDRMHSPDLFWGNRRVSAAPSGPEPRESVPRGMVHLSKVLVNLHRTSVPPSQPLQVSASPPPLTLTFRFFLGGYKALTNSFQLVKFTSGIPALSIWIRTRFEDLAGASGSSSERASSPLFRFVGVGGPSEGSRYTPAIEDDDCLFATSSPPFLSTPVSSYSSGTSTSGRDSENSSVASDVGI